MVFSFFRYLRLRSKSTDRKRERDRQIDRHIFDFVVQADERTLLLVRVNEISKQLWERASNVLPILRQGLARTRRAAISRPMYGVNYPILCVCHLFFLSCRLPVNSSQVLSSFSLVFFLFILRLFSSTCILHTLFTSFCSSPSFLISPIWILGERANEPLTLHSKERSASCPY